MITTDESRKTARGRVVWRNFPILIQRAAARCSKFPQRVSCSELGNRPKRRDYC